MPLPDNFNPWEHLQGQYNLQFNKLVRSYFSDHDPGWEPNLNSARDSLHTACLMLDDDSDSMRKMRHDLFFDLLGYSKKNLAVIHGSTENFDAPVAGHPLVKLYFSQDSESVPKGYTKVDAEISFRLMNETAATFTPSNAHTLATKIKAQFVTAGKGVKFTKGKDIYAYRDTAKGYRLQVYCTTENDAIDIIKRCLEVQDVLFSESNLSKHEPKKTSQPKTPKKLVYGKEREGKRYRPIANVFFRSVVVEVPGMNKEIVLYDVSGRLGGLVF
ncbi:hypothetical protein CDG77_14020 [Nostoc sp. 'Peltigera membranacea cyanobiont' 213]|uniref:hypothetical protein n=1 Tax=Nostoc sp. 'Peltigera membranacea cyanobiont' 213 TaxID=2014530 RepID=UPI000B951DF9|nr:hypothetical protein [Nostoc sp. 'Peltigera membranacea cyanobiont' 213]OYD92765.1 hypothetical protein CDG77_14020 [Nostoc sp. 'Peltigera membranacea cyanobiont' 213]